MNLAPPLLAVSLALVLSACGKKEEAAPPAPAPEAAAPAEMAPMPPAAPAPEAMAPAAEPAMSTADAGKKVYDSVCVACHATGVTGAPKAGDKADWGPRIAQGTDLLHKHALEGFTGKKGMMPPRGGATTLSDDEVKAAVDYMVSLAK